MATNNSINQYSEQLAIAPDAIGTTSRNEPLVIHEDFDGTLVPVVRNRENDGGSTGVNVRYELGARDTSGNLLGGNIQLGNDLSTLPGGSGTDSQLALLINANVNCTNGVYYRASSSGSMHRWAIDTTGSDGVEELRLTTNGLSFDAGTYEWKVEKGTFSPTIFGSSTAGTPTYSYQVGRYQKVGTQVQISGGVGWTALSGSAGNLRMGGLPFTVANVSSYTPGVGITPVDVASSSAQIALELVLNTTRANVSQHPNDGSTPSSNVPHNAWYGSNPTINFSGSYESTT